MTSIFKDRHYQADFPVIDMDGHIWDPPAIFSEYLEPKYREMAKTVFQGDTPGLGNIVQGKKVGAGHKYRMYLETEEAAQVNKPGDGYRYPGEDDPYVRLSCMDAEGIDKMIVRNTVTPWIFHCDLKSYADMVEAICVAYNNWCFDFCQADPNRLLPEALLPCFDMEMAMKELERTAKLGFKSTCLPGSSAAGIPLSDPYWDKMFSCMEEMGWPLFIHPGFDAKVNSITAHLLSPTHMCGSSREAYMSIFFGLNFLLDNIVTLGEITLGGMLDKHPQLNTVFIESGSSWRTEVLYRLDKQFHAPWTMSQTETYCRGMELKAKTPPSELVDRQVYFMFEGGDRGQTRETVEAFADNLVWCSDIPHFDADGPWEGGGCLRDILKVSPEVERKIMGGNAARLLDIPYEKAIGTSPKTKPIPAWALPAA